MLYFVEMGQGDFCVVAFTLLGVFTWNRDLCVSQVPPIRETLTVIQSRVSSTECFVKALKVSIIVNWCKYLKRVALNQEVVAMDGIVAINDVLPLASTILVFHEMPVRALFHVWMLPETTITVEIDR